MAGLIPQGLLILLACIHARIDRARRHREQGNNQDQKARPRRRLNEDPHIDHAPRTASAPKKLTDATS